jgi:uncharacterized membrane protein
MAQDDYTERLAHDVAVWEREGLISHDQERAILARIGAGEPRLIGALRMGWLVTAVSIIGALILGAGVVMLFATNWQEMPDWFRTAVILAGMLAAYGLGYVLTYRYDLHRVGGALLFLGVLLYEAGLFLFTAIYDLPVTNPWLMLLAAIGALPMAYAFGSRIVLLLGIANLITWAVWGLLARYEDTGKTDSVLIVIGVLGVILYAVGRLHTLRAALEKFSEVYLFAGTLLTLSLVYVFTFDEAWRAIIDEGIESFAAPPLVYVSIGVAAALVALQWRLRQRDTETDVETGILAVLLVVALVVATWPTWVGYAIVFNAVYFTAAVGIVTHGYLRGDERYVNFGLFVVALGILTRYVDLFWPLLNNEGTASVFFLVGGLVLLAVAFGLERLRRTLVSRMEDEGDGSPPAPPLVAPPRGAEGGAP